MKMPRKKFWTVPLCALCAAALTLSAWASNAPREYGTPEAARSVVSDAETEDLFYGYLLQRAGASNRASLMADAGSKLNAKDKELYDWLKVWVAKIASGEETSSVYEIVYDDFPKTWTAAELGVSDCFSDEGEAAINAKIRALYDYDADAVFDALLADCPYELYWYDKSESGGVQFRYYGANYQGYSEEITLTSTPKYTVRMSVAWDYGGGTTVNRALHDGIDKVVTTAQSIVRNYADKSDYEKLLGYSTEICNLTDYNNAAADSRTNTPYGDPWQLISVFDGDPNTKVVCEGYAKAFKYLCDLSSFRSPKTECYLVTGVLSNGTGAGAHMWNIVTMDNGKSYLTDVTNSDSNGNPEYLLLKGGSPDDPEATRYTFDDWITFAYDGEVFNLWDRELLTLDVTDYKDAEPTAPAALRLGGYALSASGDAVTMAHIRDGASVTVTKDDSETESNVTLFLVLYNSQGRMEGLQHWELDFSRSAATVQTQAVPDAACAKLIILNENFTPLAPAAALE